MLDRLDTLKEISQELDRSNKIFPHFHSTHEGYAVILEEVHELWEMVRNNKEVVGDENMRKECIQIAAITIRFIEDLCQ